MSLSSRTGGAGAGPVPGPDRENPCVKELFTITIKYSQNNIIRR